MCFFEPVPKVFQVVRCNNLLLPYMRATKFYTSSPRHRPKFKSSLETLAYTQRLCVRKKFADVDSPRDWPDVRLCGENREWVIRSQYAAERVCVSSHKGAKPRMLHMPENRMAGNERIRTRVYSYQLRQIFKIDTRYLKSLLCHLLSSCIRLTFIYLACRKIFIFLARKLMNNCLDIFQRFK